MNTRPHKLNVPPLIGKAAGGCEGKEAVNSNMDRRKLKSLCWDYVWCLMTGLRIGRFEAHLALCDYIGVDHHNEELMELTDNLDKVGLPTTSTGHEMWVQVTGVVATRLCDKILEVFGDETETNLS